MSWPSTAPSVTDLVLLDETIKHVARSRRLSPQDAQDFAQSAHLKLVERNYDVFTRFARRSSLRTYLTVVVIRLLLDWRNSTRGKWRPAAVAVRLGAHAIELDRLVHRDGFSTDEAVEIVSRQPGSPSPGDLRKIVDLLPARIRRQTVSDDALGEVCCQSFEDPFDVQERRRREASISRALGKALGQLPVEDRRLIWLRFGQRRSVTEIAETLGTDRKRLYRRYDRALRSLRRTLVASGVTGPACVASDIRVAGSRCESQSAAAYQ